MNIVFSRKKKSERGFTLVELAIVLVIIGLIVSGVLVGQDLIKAAELRATVKQVQGFQLAVNTFSGKYGGIPGDIQGDRYNLDGSASYIDGSAGDGDGNGIITSTGGADILTLTGEMSTFWSNLSTSGRELLQGVFNGDGCASSSGDTNCYAGEDFPKLKSSGTGWAVFGDSSTRINYFATGLVSGDSTVTNTINDFVPIDAYNIDIKVDDGLPTSGEIQALGLHATNVQEVPTSNAGVSATACVNSTPTPNEYQFTATANQCRLRFQMQTF